MLVSQSYYNIKNNLERNSFSILGSNGTVYAKSKNWTKFYNIPDNKTALKKKKKPNLYHYCGAISFRWLEVVINRNNSIIRTR